MSVRASAEVLGRIPLFAECERAHLQVLAFSSRRCEFAGGEAIIRQGNRGEAAYVILNGVVEIQAQEGTRLHRLAVAEAGTLLGEMAMIAGLSYSVSGIARGEAAAAAIDRDVFVRIVREFPDFGVRVQRALSRKLEATCGELAGVREIFDRAQSFAR